MDNYAVAELVGFIIGVLGLIFYFVSAVNEPLPPPEERPPWDAANWNAFQWENYKYHLTDGQKRLLMGASGRKQLRAAAKGERQIYWVPSDKKLGKLMQISADEW